jgi:hypothetical protein
MRGLLSTVVVTAVTTYQAEVLRLGLTVVAAKR